MSHQREPSTPLRAAGVHEERRPSAQRQGLDLPQQPRVLKRAGKDWEGSWEMGNARTLTLPSIILELQQASCVCFFLGGVQ